MSDLGVIFTMSFKSVPIIPLRSATPIPMIVTSTVPRGGNPTKLSTASVNIRRIFSAVSKLTGTISWPEAGWMADKFAFTASQLRTGTEAARTIYMSNGSGRRLPTSSTILRNLFRAPAFGAAEDFGGVMLDSREWRTSGGEPSLYRSSSQPTAI